MKINPWSRDSQHKTTTFRPKAQKRNKNCRHLILTFLSQLGKENLGEGGYLVDIVDNTEGHVTDLSLHLDHVVQDQPGQHGQGILPNLEIYDQWIKILTFRKRNPDLSTFQPFWPLWLSDILNIWPFDHLTLRFMTFWTFDILKKYLTFDILTIWLSDLGTF